MELNIQNPKYTWKPDDVCFFQEKWSERVVKGVVTKTYMHGDTPAAEIRCIETHGTCAQPLSALFRTRHEAIVAAQDESDRRVAGYEAMMPDAESMVRFAYSHVVSPAEEYTDWDARKAYANRAKALLGIDLD